MIDPHDGAPVSPNPTTQPTGTPAGHASAEAPTRNARPRRRLLAVLPILLLLIAFGAGMLLDRVITASPPSAGDPGSSPVAVASDGPRDVSPGPRSPGASAVAPSEPVGSAGGSPVPSGGPSGTTRPVGSSAATPADAPADFGVFWEALRIAREHYVDRSALTDRNLTYGAIEGMIRALGDTDHTTFLTPEDLKGESEALQGTVTGIGAFLGARDQQPVIESVIRGGPADRAGLRSGDVIISVDGQRVRGLSPAEVASRVRGTAGTTVKLEILHSGGTAPVAISIVREKVTVPAVAWSRIPGTELVDLQIAQFSAGTGEQFRTALRTALATNPRGAVLDLRSNPGGFVDEAVNVASQFLRQGTVYQLQNAKGERRSVPVKAGGLAPDLPLVVLVDSGTASSAEIVTGALQDAGRATVIGQPTVGTGTVLNTFPLSDGSAVRIGVEQWLTPKGERIFGVGITPTTEVALPAEGRLLGADDLGTLSAEALRSSGDAQLLRAIDQLVGGG